MKRIEKPWGYEKILEHNDFYVLKELFMKKGHRCSLQYHERKMETIYVLKGTLGLQIGDMIKEFSIGSVITIKPGTIHRMIGIDDALYLEASTNQLDDVIRIEDDYNRA